MIEPIIAQLAPPAIGPYSHAVECSGSMLFLSGQVALNVEGVLVGETIEQQTDKVIDNITTILEAKGATLSNVVKTTVFLVDMTDFAAMNNVYAVRFGNHRPARSTIQVSRLPKDARIEIEVIACLD